MGTESSREFRNYRALKIFSVLRKITGSSQGLMAICLLPALLLGACSTLHSRPVLQMSYAEAAVRSAAAVGAETSQPYLFQLSRDALLRAHSAYRLKNFDLALKMAIRARRIAEDAETKALTGQIEAEKIYSAPADGAVEIE